MNSERVLILSPHTDDAELGCGGTIVKLIKQKKEILWIVFSTAEESLPKGLPKDSLVKEFIKVVKSLDLKPKNYKIFNYKVRKLSEKRQEVLEELIRIRNEFKPNLVIGPSLNDFHQDHSVVSYEMIRAFKTSSSIICYELPWNHVKFDTQLFIRLSNEEIRKKVEMLNFYKSQYLVKKHYFSTEFIEGLASTRGVQIGTKFAEAFEVVRWIEN